MSTIDYTVMFSVLIAIAAYGMWKTRQSSNLNTYLKGDDSIKWGTIGLSVMATQASAITFLSTPGQAFEEGMGFVQNYFGMPFAIIIISAVFIPIYHRLKVYTAYEYLGKRFDLKTRLLGAVLFLLSRGIAAGITIYAPAIIVSTILGWNLDLTILLVGIFVISYTVSGGTKAVSLTQRYQMTIILIGMVVAFFIIVYNLPSEVSFIDSLSIVGSQDKLNVIDWEFDWNNKYTVWSGILGGIFLSLSYFGTDQSQVQRYLAGASIKESRLGLLFNAVVKIPMQFFILLVGVMVFAFYQFEKPPLFFNETELEKFATSENAAEISELQARHDATFSAKREASLKLTELLKTDNQAAIDSAKVELGELGRENRQVRDDLVELMKEAEETFETEDADYVFITFILDYMPIGIVGLLMAVIFAAAMSSTASELNALGSTFTIDVYKKILHGKGSDHHYVVASKWFTFMWGVIAVCFAFTAKLMDNLIEYVNKLGSVFYGVILGAFLVAFFIKFVKGHAVFFATVVSQLTVITLYFTTEIAYLWFNPIGSLLVVTLSIILQTTIFANDKGKEVPSHDA